MNLMKKSIAIKAGLGGRLSMLACLFFAWGMAQADAPMKKDQAPAFYRMMIGKFEVTALLDENSPWPDAAKELFPQLSEQQMRTLFAQTHLQKNHDFSTIAFLINTGKKLVLIDTGGKGAGPSYGKLFDNLRAAGYSPGQVDDIYITHMHPDHVGGLMDGSKRAFPNAVMHADVHEFPQWEKAAEKGNAAAKRIVQLVRPYQEAGKFESFAEETTFFDGFRSIPTHGHSEGHSFYQLESEGQSIEFWGDFVVHDKIQLTFPEMAPPGESDAHAGIELHRSVFQAAATSGKIIAGAHFSFPGIGRIRQIGGAFVWVPIDYANIPAVPNP